MHRLCLCATVAMQTCCIWQTPRVSSNCKAWVVSLMCFVLVDSARSTLPNLLSHFVTSPLLHPPANCPHPLLPVTLYSLFLSLSPMSFNSIKGQSPTSLPLHPHLLSVFFSRWCNSTVRCLGHHKLTRSLIAADLMSGKERGREREHKGWRQRAHLHICLETWKTWGEEGRIAVAQADIIIIIKDEREDRKVSGKRSGARVWHHWGSPECRFPMETVF